jgi:hypothetical protein
MTPQVGETTFNYLAPGYEDVMHGACITCHEEQARAQAEPELAQCPACHQQENNDVVPQMALSR